MRKIAAGLEFTYGPSINSVHLVTYAKTDKQDVYIAPSHLIATRRIVNINRASMLRIASRLIQLYRTYYHIVRIQYYNT